MSNRLSIEVATVTRRSTGESFQELHVFDDEGTANRSYEGLVPEDPAELLKLICSLDMQGYGDALHDLLDFHINDAEDQDGIDIENDWIELNDPRISEIIKAYREGDREFFGLRKDEDEDEDESSHNFKVGESILVKAGDCVIVPDPTANDIWNHEFQGHIISICDGTMKPIKTPDEDSFAIVKDQDDNTFVVKINRLKKDED